MSDTEPGMQGISNTKVSEHKKGTEVRKRRCGITSFACLPIISDIAARNWGDISLA